jgi:polyisoprenyl-phosphate glycosyltransferase
MAIDLSVVIPIRNEAPAIGELVGELTRTLTGWGGSFEIIVVDDGSTDESSRSWPGCRPQMPGCG